MIRYLNTDLDLVSANDLTTLVESLAARNIQPLHMDRHEDDLWYATFEAGVCWEQPEDTITVLLAAIESLDEPQRRAWWYCSTREFHVGYECRSEPWAFNQAISSQTLQRVTDVGAGLRITL